MVAMRDAGRSGCVARLRRGGGATRRAGAALRDERGGGVGLYPERGGHGTSAEGGRQAREPGAVGGHEEGLGPRAVGAHQFVPVEQQVVIARDPAGGPRADPGPAEQPFRGDEDPGRVLRQRDPVLRRDQQFPGGRAGAEGAGAEADRRRPQRAGRQAPRLAPDPAQRPKAVIARQHALAGAQGLHGPRPRGRLDQGALEETDRGGLEAEIRRRDLGDVQPADIGRRPVGQRDQRAPGAVVADMGLQIGVGVEARIVDDEDVALVRRIGLDRVVMAAGSDDEPVRAGMAVERVVAGAAFERVVARIPVQLVVAVAAANGIVAVMGVDGIVPRAAPERVVAGVSVQLVVAIAAANGIVAVMGVDVIVPRAALERVVARVALQLVVPGAAASGVVAVICEDEIVARAPVERVVSPLAAQCVVAPAAGEGLAPCPAGDGVVAGSVRSRRHAASPGRPPRA